MVFGCFAGFLAAEFFLRIINNETLRPENFLLRDNTLLHGGYPVSFDSEIGWVPDSRKSGQVNLWDTTVTISPDSLRSNGRPAKSIYAGEERILASGDSFTFGDEVSDSETWPAYLEDSLDISVLNAGVPGYGLDQIVLRAEKLAVTVKPSLVLLNFIINDVYRCQLSKRAGAPKPYFTIENGALNLKNTPVPSPQLLSQREKFGSVRLLAGYSYVLNRLLSNTVGSGWLLGPWAEDVKVSDQGKQIACALFSRVKSWSETNHVPVVLIAHATNEVALEDQNHILDLEKCAEAVGLRFLNLVPVLLKEFEREPEGYRPYFKDSHMSPRGNKQVAELIKQYLRAERLVSVTPGLQKN